MSVPTWLNEAAPYLNGDNVAHNPSKDSSTAFFRSPSAASLDPSQLQYQQMQLRIQNDNTRHGSPSSQSPIYNTQNVVPSKRNRQQEESIDRSPQSYPGAPPVARSHTPQGTYPRFQGAVNGGSYLNGLPAYQHFQQPNNNSNQSPITQHQNFNPQISSPAVHTMSPSPYSPAPQSFGAQNSPSQPDHTGRVHTTQRGGQLYPPYGVGQAHPLPVNTTNNGMPISPFSNPQNLTIQQQRMNVTAKARQVQQRQSHVQSAGVNIPQRQQGHSMNFSGHPIDTMKTHHMAQMRQQVQAQARVTQARKRVAFLHQLLRSMVQYMQTRRLPFNTRPIITSKPVSCVPIFLLGMKLGGSRKIERLNQWPQVAQSLSFPQSQLVAAGKEIQVYWGNNLVQWERYFMQMQQSTLQHTQHRRRPLHRPRPPFLRQQRQQTMRGSMRIMEHSQRVDPLMRRGFFSRTKKMQDSQRKRLIQPPKLIHHKFQRPATSQSAAQVISRRGMQNGVKRLQEVDTQRTQSNTHRARVLARRQEIRRFLTRQHFTRPRIKSENIFPKIRSISAFPKFKSKDGFRKMKLRKTFPKFKSKDVFSKLKSNYVSPEIKSNPPVPEIKPKGTPLNIELRSPRPLERYYTPKFHALDPSIYRAKGLEHPGDNSILSKAAIIFEEEDETSETQLRTEYHGGLPISNPWFKDTLDVLVKYKHSMPQLNELGVIDIQALVLSIKSGIHGEVRLALDIIAALSHARPPPLKDCGELLETLIDFANDQIEILAEGSISIPDAFQIPSHQEQVRSFRTQSYIVQEVPGISSRCRDLDRAASRLVSVTTILRNLSLRSDNHENLQEPSVIRMITTVIRYLGTRDQFLLTFQNVLDFSKDIVIFLSSLSPSIKLTTKDEGLSILRFLLSFAPEPRPNVQGEEISFALYVPEIHHYLPHAVDTLAKLFAQDPNRTLYRSIFASESTSSPPFDLLTRAFGLAVSVIPEVVHHQDRANGIMTVRNPTIAQGLLSAEILIAMLPTSAHGLAYAWLNSQDGFVSRLMAVLSLISKIPISESQRHRDGRLRTDNNLHLGYRMISARGLAVLRKLTEKAQDNAPFIPELSSNVFASKQGVIRASDSNESFG